MTHTIVIAFFCTDNNTIDLIVSNINGILQSIEIQLIITIV